METTATTPVRISRYGPRARRVLGPIAEGRTYRELAYVALTLPLATAWFCILLTGWIVAAVALPFIVGLPVLIGVFVVSDWCVTVERAVARGLLDAPIGAASPPPRAAGILAKLRQRLTDRRTWRRQLFLIGRFVIGFWIATAIISFGGWSLAAIPAPLLLLIPGFDYWGGIIDTPLKGLLLVPIGVAGVIATGWLIRGYAAASTRAAAWSLSDAGIPANGAAAPPPGAEARRARTRLMRSLPAQAGAKLAVVAARVLIWALTGGTFWPVWIVLGLGLVLGFQLALVGALGLEDIELRWLAIHAALAVELSVLCVSLWAGTASPSFWPVWVMIGLGLALALHAAVVQLRRRTGAAERARLERRVKELTHTRAGAVEAEASELQRIERDLHDGAQARLVALSMNIGLAEERMDTDPQRTRELLADAKADARLAISELRALARGIAPPVLLDRGLEAAVAALAGGSPIPIAVDAQLGSRPSHAVERAAYFTIAEAVANAAKHSGATAIRVQLRRDGDELVARVGDDGRGGADPRGAGLTGLRQRVAALDGSLVVQSPPAGGTLVEARLPCAA